MSRKNASLSPDRPWNDTPRIFSLNRKRGWVADLGRSLKTPLRSDKGSFEEVAPPQPSARTEPAPNARKRLSLALQGGGAFGAFTWGVLDRLLEEDIDFDAVRGASAGAINAVLLASGLAAAAGPRRGRASIASGRRSATRPSPIRSSARRSWRRLRRSCRPISSTPST